MSTPPSHRRPAADHRAGAGKHPGSDADADALPDALDPTSEASITEADGAPPPPSTRQVIRRATVGNTAMAMLRRFLDADVITQAAALAFYAVLSLAPLMLLLLWLTASLPDVQSALLEQIDLLVGPEATTVARTVIDNARARPDTGSIAGWWSIGLLLVGATAVFAQLQDALNRTFRTDATALAGIGDWLKKRLFSFGLLLALAFLLLVSMTVTTVLELLLASASLAQPMVATLASLIVYTVAFAFMYQFLPDRRVRWRLAVGGGFLTAVLFVLGRLAIAWYLQRAPTGSAYGAMGALALTMLWVYYAAMILFSGAVVTAIIDERSRPRPQD
ncbi:MAG: YihY/virulence factor BrkB family protein [Pseudoxanthomonas suwonensis]|nr:YihY/virulence factor BrkB family protein [Pseudoxanthomonas suwonensis]